MMVKINEIKNSNKEELHKLFVDLKRKFFNIRFQKSEGNLSDTSQIRKVRKDIARVLTVFNERDY